MIIICNPALSCVKVLIGYRNNPKTCSTTETLTQLAAIAETELLFNKLSSPGCSWVLLPRLLCLKEPLPDVFWPWRDTECLRMGDRGMVTVSWGWKQPFTKHSLSLKGRCVEIQCENGLLCLGMADFPLWCVLLCACGLRLTGSSWRPFPTLMFPWFYVNL